MRDAIGSTWVFSICLAFIILFTAYLSISLNYARLFRVKSNVVGIIEENEGYNATARQRIESYLNTEGQTASGNCSPYIIDNSGADDWQLTDTIILSGSNPAACIYRRNKKESNDINQREVAGNCRDYYKVILFMKFDLPVVGSFVKFKVGGETRLVHDYAGC